jgi:NitT/TauT family transport system substrate-binding protein
MIRFRAARMGTITAAALAAAALALVGCSSGGGGGSSSSSKPLTTLNVRTSFSFSPSNENTFLAIDKGYFAAEGLKVNFKEGNGSTAVLQLMPSGDTDIGVTIDADTAAQDISGGIPAKIAQLGTTVAPFGTICYKSANVTSAHDLKGKSVIVVPSESTAAVLPAFLALHGLTVSDINLVNANYTDKTPLFLAGKADCMIGYTSSELVQAQMQDPSKLGQPMSWAADGLKLLGDATVVSDKLAKQPDIVAAFLRAYDKGTAYMCANQAASAAAYNAANPTLTALNKQYSPIGIKAYCSDMTANGSPFAGVSDSTWSSAMTVLQKYNGMKSVLPHSDYFMTNLPVIPSVSW